MNWEQVDVLDYIGLEEYRDTERFGVLLMKGRKFCTRTKGLIRLTAHGAINLW